MSFEATQKASLLSVQRRLAMDVTPFHPPGGFHRECVFDFNVVGNDCWL
jgi:hypothetical protein